jgi:hypothetical protein
MSTRSRRRKQGKAASGGGALRGMRSGFKKAAGVAAGDATKPPAKSPIGTIVTVLLLIAAVALFLYRRR